jgi:hypothetical protein
LKLCLLIALNYKKRKQTKEQKNKRTKEQRTNKEQKMSSTKFAQNVYDFQMEVFNQLLTEFDGKVVGSEDLNLEKLKDKFFEGYTPGDKVSVKKKEKKEKKPRALSGYTYFGQQNKDKFNEEMNAMDEKPKFVSYVGGKWKALSEEEQSEWKEKAATAFKDSQNS